MKTWVTPKLVVLRRGSEQEFVLLGCKTNIGSASGSDGARCAGKSGQSLCELCSSTSGS